MTWTSTPKSMEEVAIEVMQADKVTELFQTMAIISLNMGNLKFGGEQFEKQISHKRERIGDITSGIEQGEGLLEGI